MAQQTVLRGQGNEPAIDQLTGLPLTMEELLRRRGMIAYGGNVRLMPFDAANAPSSAPEGASSTNGVAPTSAAGTSTSNGAGVDANGNIVAPTEAVATPAAAPIDEQALKAETGGVDKATLDAMSLPELDGWLKTIGVGAGFAIGGMLATYLAGRKAAAGATAVDPLTPIPLAGANTANGASNVPAVAGEDIVDGEFTEVNDAKRLPAPAAAKTAPKDSVSNALGDRLRGKGIEQRGDTPKPREQRRLERQQTGARQANASRELPAGNKAPQLDSFGALPEHMQEAAMIETQKIIEERARGRRASLKSNARDTFGISQRGRRAPGGTSTGDVDPESVLEQVSRRFLDAWRSNPNLKKVRVK